MQKEYIVGFEPVTSAHQTNTLVSIAIFAFKRGYIFGSIYIEDRAIPSI
jgi:hypothetical protein